MKRKKKRAEVDKCRGIPLNVEQGERFSYFGPEWGGPSVCVEVEEEAGGGGGDVSIGCADEEEESAGPCWVDPSLAWP